MRKPLDYPAFLRLLARTWNLAHGRTQPETDESRLEEMVRLVASEDMDIALLQEIPVWGLGELERWSGRRCSASLQCVPTSACSVGGNPIEASATSLGVDWPGQRNSRPGQAQLVGSRRDIAAESSRYAKRYREFPRPRSGCDKTLGVEQTNVPGCPSRHARDDYRHRQHAPVTL